MNEPKITIGRVGVWRRVDMDVDEFKKSARGRIREYGPKCSFEVIHWTHECREEFLGVERDMRKGKHLGYLSKDFVELTFPEVYKELMR